MKAITLPYSGKLPIHFYQQKNVCKIARALIGKLLVTAFDGKITAVRIVETEAYNGEVDKASHAWNGRRTQRTETMYAAGGISYVYLCYGIHHLYNVVTNVAGIPHAILLRAGEPVAGIETMLERTGKKKPDHSITRGPGNLSKAMGILTAHNALRLDTDGLCILDDGFSVKSSQIAATPRIGVDYAGDDALLPYRFILKNNPFVSGKNK